ncbi:hypothetical protein niasHT_029108 [Heterodera trifolii]|uniref:Transmembrane protein 180 n=1 Tax=Heterodera trifolii TaxID=157864 RepID=A0ABD2KN81_9BILA
MTVAVADNAKSNNNAVLAIFFGQFGIGLMHTTFMFYYVKVFLNIFQVNEYWFNWSQLLFLIWNAINDPLFGYLQDVGGTWMKDRGKIFTYFGPFLVLSFLITWFPWRSAPNSPPYVEGLHLIVSLFLYDAFFSCIGVAWSALYSDSTRDHRKRVRGIKYAQLASLCSVNVITVTEKMSHSLENFGAFQFICIGMGIISLCCLYMAGHLGGASLRGSGGVPLPSGHRLLRAEDDKDQDDDGTSDDSDGCGLLGEKEAKLAAIDSDGTDTWQWARVAELTKQLVSAKDFQCIVFTNFIHILRSVSHMNFAVIATDILIPQTVLPKGSWQLSAFFAVCTLLPQIIVITNDKFLLRKGTYRVMMYGLLASVCSAFLYALSASPLVIILFMVLDSVTVHAIAPLFNILFSEFIEDDKQRYARKNPVSSLVFSLNALFTKPAISIAPVVIVYLLNQNGYELYRSKGHISDQLRVCMARVLFVIPLLLGTVELLAFRHYSLRHKHRPTSALPI